MATVPGRQLGQHMAPATGVEPEDPSHTSHRAPPCLADLPPNVLQSISHFAGTHSRQLCHATLSAYGPLLASRPLGIHTPADLLLALQTLASRSPTLHTLDLTHCGPAFDLPTVRSLPIHTPHLRHLTLRHCPHLTPPLLRTLAALPFLATLDLHRCLPAFTPPMLDILTEGQAAASLRHLTLDLDHRATATDDGILALCQLSELRELRTLSLSGINDTRSHAQDIMQQVELASMLAPTAPPPIQPPGHAQQPPPPQVGFAPPAPQLLAPQPPADPPPAMAQQVPPPADPLPPALDAPQNAAPAALPPPPPPAHAPPPPAHAPPPPAHAPPPAAAAGPAMLGPVHAQLPPPPAHAPPPPAHAPPTPAHAPPPPAHAPPPPAAGPAMLGPVHAQLPQPLPPPPPADPLPAPLLDNPPAEPPAPFPADAAAPEDLAPWEEEDLPPLEDNDPLPAPPLDNPPAEPPADAAAPEDPAPWEEEDLPPLVNDLWPDPVDDPPAAPVAVSVLLEVTGGLPHLHTLHLLGSFFLQDDPPDPNLPPQPPRWEAPSLPSTLLTLNRGLTSLTCTLGTRRRHLGWAAPPPPLSTRSSAALLDSIASMAGHLRHLDLTLAGPCSGSSLRACLECLNSLASLRLAFSHDPPPLIMDAISQNMTQLTCLRLAAAPGAVGFDDLPQTEWLRDLAPTLRVLDLAQERRLGSRALQAVAALTGLTELRLSKLNGRFTGTRRQAPSEIGCNWLYKLPNLQALHLQEQDPVTWAPAEHPASSFPALTALSLNRCPCSPDLHAIATHLPHLRLLDLRSSYAFHPKDLAQLRRLVQLQELLLTLNTQASLVAASLAQHLVPPPRALQRLCLSLLQMSHAPQVVSRLHGEDLRELRALLAGYGCAVVVHLPLLQPVD